MAKLIIDVKDNKEIYIEKNEISKEESRNYFIYNDTFEIINDMLKKVDDKKGDYENIITYFGDRGSGKTTALLNFVELLKNNKRMDLNEEINETLKKVDFEVLDVFDPTIFNDGDSFIEILISKLYGQFQAHHNKIDDSDLKNSLLKLFANVYENLKYIRTDNHNYYEKSSASNISILQNLSTSIEIKKNISKLINKYLEFCMWNSNDKRRILVIPIDDMDLNEKHFAKMFDELRKYLSISNVIIIMANKFEKVRDNIRVEELHRSSMLLEHKFTSNTDVDNAVNDYLNKVIPFNKRIYISNITVDDEVILKNINGNEDKIEGNPNEVFAELLFMKTGHMIYCERQIFHYLLKNNIRHLRNVFLFLVRLDDVYDTKKSSLNIKDMSVAKYNNELFWGWIKNSMATEMLDDRELNIFKSITNAHLSYLNFTVIRELTPLEGLKSTDYESLENKDNLFFNYSLGDVLSYIRKFQNNTNKSLSNLLYLVKYYYSYLLTDNMVFNEFEGVPYKEKMKIVNDYNVITGGDFVSLIGNSLNSKFNYIEDVNYTQQEIRDILLSDQKHLLSIFIQNRRTANFSTDTPFRRYREMNGTPFYSKDIYLKTSSGNLKNYFMSLTLPLYTTNYLQYNLMNYAFDFNDNNKEKEDIKKTFEHIIDSNKMKTFIIPMFNIELFDEMLKRAILEYRRSIRFASHLDDFITHFYNNLRNIYKNILDIEDRDYKRKYIDRFSQLQIVTDTNEKGLCSYFITKRDDKNGVSNLTEKKLIKNMARTMTFDNVREILVKSFDDGMKESVIKSFDEAITSETSTKFNKADERNKVVKKVYADVMKDKTSALEVEDNEQ